jgi:hypothetical protein
MGSQKYLYEVAIKFMLVPATSDPSERVFSKTGEIITERRNRLSGKNIDMLLFSIASSLFFSFPELE